MQYQKVLKAKFQSRPNRFIAKVLIDGKEEIVHVKNTGRCKELLVPGGIVYLSDEEKAERKTRYDLIAVEKICDNGKKILINMDSQAPNKVAEEFFRSGKFFSKDALVKREVKFQNSRFDFFITDGDRKIFVEVKGVTLENNGIAMFPDAPTERGVKHLLELIEAKKSGYEAMIFFVIQMKEINSFSPNDITHPAFGKALRKAKEKSVEIFAYNSKVTRKSLAVSDPVKIKL